ncbi:MAG: hypothetical protein ACO1PW_11155 [Actinomycetota bacterium]
MAPRTEPQAPTGDDPDAVVLVLVRGTDEHVLGPVRRGDRCGLGFIDDLLHLQVALRRLGWRLRVDDVAPELEELLELTGLRDQL